MTGIIPKTVDEVDKLLQRFTVGTDVVYQRDFKNGRIRTRDFQNYYFMNFSTGQDYFVNRSMLQSLLDNVQNVIRDTRSTQPPDSPPRWLGFLLIGLGLFLIFLFLDR